MRIRLVAIILEHCLSHIIDIPTRQDRTLDSKLTNNHPCKRIKSMPPIGRDDIKAKRVLQSPRKVFLYKRVDTPGLKDRTRAFADRFMSQNFALINAIDMWIKFKTVFLFALDKFIPPKNDQGKIWYTWIDAIRAPISKKEKLYHKARRSNDESLESRYKRLRAYVQKEISDAYWRYVSNN